jgi:hypothetical protein
VGVVFTEDLEDAFSHLESDIVVVLDSDSLRQQSKQHIEQLRTAYMVQSLKARSIGVSTWPLVTPSRWSGSCQDLLKNSGDRFVTETRQVPSGWSVFPEAPFEVPLQNSWLSLHRKAKSLIRLNVGWDGDRAPPPQNFAVQNARRVLLALQDQALLPSKLNPTVVGGIGITIKRCDKKAYIECSNKGSVLLLLSDGESEPQVTKFEPSENRFRSLIDAARTYLHE